MLASVGNTIQSFINNTPVSTSVNETSTTVVTNGGNVYQAGLINNQVQYSFEEIVANVDIVGQVVSSVSTDNKVYLLNKAGSVFEYDYMKDSSCPIFKEVYSPGINSGDKAVKIEGGSNHIVILTECNKAYGVGNNMEYQLVPQGQCVYDCATQIIITDTNVHDGTCCDKFTGILRLETLNPQQANQCNETKCLTNTVTGVPVAQITFTGVTITPPVGDPFVGNITVPIVADYSYVGVLCVRPDGIVSGTLTITVDAIYIPAGDTIVTITNTTTLVTVSVPANVSSLVDIVALLNLQLGVDTITLPITGTVVLATSASIRCNTEATFPLTSIVTTFPALTDLTLAGAPFTLASVDSTISLTGVDISLVLTIPGYTFDITAATVSVVANVIPIAITCCPTKPCCSKEASCPCPVGQPCWTNVFAGFDTTVLVDNCNRIYVLGSIHKVRNNAQLFKKSCLEEILNKSVASVAFPANELNCCVRPNNESCPCVKCRNKCFKTDLSKFGVQLNFADGYCVQSGVDNCDCTGDQYSVMKSKTNVCDFLKALQNCNESPTCNNTCETCDTYIYINLAGACGCPCPPVPPGVTPVYPSIGTVRLLNSKSVCRYQAQGLDIVTDAISVAITDSSVVEFGANKYCIDGQNYCLDNVIDLVYDVTSTVVVTLYVDVCNAGGIQFTNGGDRCNVEFQVLQPTAPVPENQSYILNYGDSLDPAALANLKGVLLDSCCIPCPCYAQPDRARLINTYLKGGDRVQLTFIPTTGVNAGVRRQAVTSDVPTVFRLNRRVLDIGVGHNNLSVLVGGLKCPNEIYVIGMNCYGELGINSNETTLCFKQVNRCLFDCHVVKIFSGRYVTFYLTQSYRVYASGLWKCLVNSNIPVCVPGVCQSWQIKEVAVAKNHLVLLGKDGAIFGMGDNRLGELGLCHLNCVKKPVPLTFFYKLNQCVAKRLSEGLSHPLLRDSSCCKCKTPKCTPCEPTCYGNPCERDSCDPDDYVSAPRSRKCYTANNRSYCAPRRSRRY